MREQIAESTLDNLVGQIAEAVAMACVLATVLVIAIGALETAVRAVRAGARLARPEVKMQIWMGFAGWILLALEFALAADIADTAVSPTWEDIGMLAAIATIRTLLNFFLARDLEKAAQRAAVPIGSVYRFFGNKRQMVDALAQRNLERYTVRVTERLRRADEDGGWRTAMDVVLDEYLEMKRTAPGFSLVDFGNQIPVGARDAEPNHRVADRLTELLSGYLAREPDDDLRRVFLIAVETADTLVHLAFRVAPEGDPRIIDEAREMLRAYLARVLD